jgi:threonine dehydrogenase-like Zn-dependent dehydrogenase
MKAAVLSEYNLVEWKEVPKPECKPEEVLIRVSFGSICGSDQHIFKGEFHPRTSTPMIMGHEFTGEIVEVGSEVKGFDVGDKVAPDPIIWCGTCPACLRGHYPACTGLKLTLPPSMLYKLSSGISDEHAALIEILSIGFHAKNKAGVGKEDVIAIWGSGKVGLSILEAVRTVTDQHVYMVDVLEERLAIGPAHYEHVIPINASRENPVERIFKDTQGKGVDIAFEAVGHALEVEGQVNPVRGCVQIIRGGGTVCVLGLGNEPSAVVFKELIWKEGRIVASRVSHGEFSECIDHLERGTLKPDALISRILPASLTQEAFEILDSSPAENIKILLDFNVA